MKRDIKRMSLARALVVILCCKNNVLSWTILHIDEDEDTVNNGIMEFTTRPPACQILFGQDGKQEINLEWPNFATDKATLTKLSW